MTYAILETAPGVRELWRLGDGGDGMNTLGLERPPCRCCGHVEVQTVDLDLEGLVIDPTDKEIAALPDADLARFGLSRAHLLGPRYTVRTLEQNFRTIRTPHQVIDTHTGTIVEEYASKRAANMHRRQLEREAVAASRSNAR